RAPLVSDAGVIGRKCSRDYHRLRHTHGRKIASRDRFPGLVGRFPLQRERGGLVLELEEIHLDGIGPAAEQLHRAALLAHFASRTDPAINRGVWAITAPPTRWRVDPKAGAIFSFEAEFVIARFI